MKMKLNMFTVVVALFGIISVQNSTAQAPNTSPAQEALKGMRPFIGNWAGESDAFGGFEGLEEGGKILWAARFRWLQNKTAVEFTSQTKYKNTDKRFNSASQIMSLDAATGKLRTIGHGHDGSVYWSNTGTMEIEGKSDDEICLLHRIGDILVQVGRTGPAEGLFSAILERVPGCARAAEIWGLMLLEQRQGDRSIEVLKRHQMANPTDIRLTLALSHAYRMTGELEEAIRLFHTTAETLAFDEQNQYLGQLLALYLTSSTVEQWVDHWREVLEWKPDHVTGRFLLGACLPLLLNRPELGLGVGSRLAVVPRLARGEF